MPTPDIPAQLGPRRSLRVTNQADPASTMSKAIKRKQTATGSSHTSGSIPLLNTFFYSRLSLDQIVDLFQVYHIRLGTSTEDRKTLIEQIQLMDRCRFELVVKDLLYQTKIDSRPVTLDLVHLSSSTL